MDGHLKKYLQDLLNIASNMDCSLYIVGGTIRDHILNRDCSDFDFTTNNVNILAKRFALETHSPCIPLDATPGRETLRVVIQRKFYFDFTDMQGNSIEEDLASRDFSINAMALSLSDFLQDTGKIIDPEGGQADLRNMRVRMVSGAAFKADPLRLLRAFRFAMQLDFKLESKTLAQIRLDHATMKTVASERIWHEWKLFLNEGRIFCLLKLMDNTGLLGVLLPELEPLRDLRFEDKDARETGVQAVKELQNILFPKVDEVSIFLLSELPREKRALLLLCALLSGLKPCEKYFKTPTEKPEIPDSAVLDLLKHLRASNLECEFIDRSLSCCREFLETHVEFTVPDRTRLYRFIKRWENEWVGGLCLAWAVLSALPHITPIQRDACFLAAKIVRDFFKEHYHPSMRKEPLLKGKDLIERFNLTPSPLFSDILDRVEEERVLGTIQTVEDAERIVRKLIENQG